VGVPCPLYMLPPNSVLLRRIDSLQNFYIFSPQLCCFFLELSFGMFPPAGISFCFRGPCFFRPCSNNHAGLT